MLSVLSIEKVPHKNIYNITVENKFTKGFLWRKKDFVTVRKYYGRCTVWYDYETGDSVGVNMRSWLSDRLNHWKTMN